MPPLAPQDEWLVMDTSKWTLEAYNSEKKHEPTFNSSTQIVILQRTMNQI